jgi:hypothetical protein
MLPLVLPLPHAYKMYLAIVGLALFVAVHVIIGVKDFRAISAFANDKTANSKTSYERKRLASREVFVSTSGSRPLREREWIRRSAAS